MEKSNSSRLAWFLSVTIVLFLCYLNAEYIFYLRARSIVVREVSRLCDKILWNRKGPLDEISARMFADGLHKMAPAFGTRTIISQAWLVLPRPREENGNTFVAEESFGQFLGSSARCRLPGNDRPASDCRIIRDFALFQQKFPAAFRPGLFSPDDFGLFCRVSGTYSMGPFGERPVRSQYPFKVITRGSAKY